MRDYKNVKVPRKYRATTHRVEAGHARRKRSALPAVSWKKTLFLAAFLIVCCMCLLGYRWAIRTEMFQISGVDIKGVKQLGEGELKTIAGVFTGQNIFYVDLEAAAQQARANFWVKDVRIYRSLPNRISMVFIERVPVVILDSATGRYLVDNEGVVIDKAAGKPEWQLPVVSIKDYKARPGEQVSTEGMVEALPLIEELSARGGWQMADVVVKAVSPETLSVVYAEQEFKIGGGRYPEKLRRLSEIMADMKARGLQAAYVDLRPERQAAVMVKNTKAASAVRKQTPKNKSKGKAARHKA